MHMDIECTAACDVLYVIVARRNVRRWEGCVRSNAPRACSYTFALSISINDLVRSSKSQAVRHAMARSNVDRWNAPCMIALWTFAFWIQTYTIPNSPWVEVMYIKGNRLRKWVLNWYFECMRYPRVRTHRNKLSNCVESPRGIGAVGVWLLIDWTQISLKKTIFYLRNLMEHCLLPEGWNNLVSRWSEPCSLGNCNYQNQASFCPYWHTSVIIR